jgi:signal transduction histidine kinase
MFWHVLYLGALGLVLVSALARAWPALGLAELALLLLVAAQVALYLWNFILNTHWPLPLWRHAVYFVGSLALWALEWRLAPEFSWLGMTYFGQMFGVLPPLVAMPSTLAIFLFYLARAADWDLAGLWPWGIIGPLMGWAGFSVIFLFIYYTTRTSEERGRLVAELRAAQRELEAARQRDAELAALRERERLARDLHDSLGHALVAVSIQLEAIQRLYRVDPARAEGQVDALKTLTRDTMAGLRRALAGLRSPGLGEQPLAAALQQLAVAVGQRSGLSVACTVSPGTERLAPAVAETLWRVAQEALTNVERHAHARTVSVDLQVLPAAASLRVSDDGQGLPPAAETLPGHFGLRGMRERVEGLGGSLRMHGAAGTVIEASLPLL